MRRQTDIRLYIESIGKDYRIVVREGFECIKFADKIRLGDRVFIKPNLTFPTFCKGVMTNPEILEALIVYFKDYTDKIAICESDSGGYNRFSMDEVFQATGILKMAQHYGVRIINMSYEPSRPIQVRCGIRKLSIPMPTFLSDEADLFITVPVPKVHCNTIVSIAIKNQWGVIQDPSLRLKLHPYFKEVIYQVNKALPKTIAVIDGKYGLTRSGPLKGDVIDLNWLLISDDIYLADYVCCKLIGMDYRRVPYLRYIFEKEGTEDLDNVMFNRDYRSFVVEKPFYLKRAWTDYPGMMTFNSRILAYIGYHSPLAKPLHWLLYRFRTPFY